MASPYLRRGFAGSEPARVARQTSSKLVVSISQGLANGIAEASGKGITQTVKAFGEFLSNDRLRSQFAAANKRIAEGAQEAYVNAYTTRTPKRQRKYRQASEGSNRLAGGVLEAALRSPKNISATTNRQIMLIDTAHMKEEARHWRRINFGSEEAGGTGPAPFSVRINDQEVTVLQWPDMRGKAVLMPQGVWRNKEGKRVQWGKGTDDAFYPKGGAIANKPTRGIKPTHFLDEGLRYVANHVGPEYFDIFATEVQKNRARVNKGLTYKVRGDVRRARFKISGPG